MPAPRLSGLAWRLACVAALASAVVTSTAHTAAAKPPIVLEVHTGPRTEASARALVRLREALESQGFAARPESILELAGGDAPRPGIVDTGITAAALAEHVHDGYSEYTQNNFEQAIALLNAAIALIQRNPGVMVVNIEHAKLIFKAYVNLANSHTRLGHDAQAAAAMTELIRMYPSVAVTRAIYGPEAEQLYRAVWKQVRAMGHGRLAITTDDSQAMIFVDNQLRGKGTAQLDDLIPGLYRVFVQVPGSAGRQYEVAVRPDGDSALDITWSIDSSLYISERWIGLQLVGDTDREREAILAGALARRWKAGTIFAVIGPIGLQGKPALIGTLYRTGGKVIRRASLILDGAEPAGLRDLARFLADGTPAAGITILAGADARRGPARKSARRGRWFIYGGVAVAAAGIGLYLIDEDPVTRPDVPVKPYYRDSAPHGIALGAVGILSIGVGLWWWHRKSSLSAPIVSVGPSLTAIGWASRF
jgi:hypothetical protein